MISHFLKICIIYLLEERYHQIGMEFANPRAATKEDIARVINGFAHAAEYLDKAGFDGIQFHGAHGYLIAQFLSNNTNKRTDEYGVSLGNRMRFIIDIATEYQKRVEPSFIFGIRLIQWNSRRIASPPKKREHFAKPWSQLDSTT
jgi:2,4-dienoyl-CoA reductase-like NADH-dependent reductase (Old Yellow Enzyme family)